MAAMVKYQDTAVVAFSISVLGRRASRSCGRTRGGDLFSYVWFRTDFKIVCCSVTQSLERGAFCANGAEGCAKVEPMNAHLLFANHHARSDGRADWSWGYGYEGREISESRSAYNEWFSKGGAVEFGARIPRECGRKVGSD